MGNAGFISSTVVERVSLDSVVWGGEGVSAKNGRQGVTLRTLQNPTPHTLNAQIPKPLRPETPNPESLPKPEAKPENLEAP